MPKNITEIPYTELFERIVELGRISPNAYPKVRGVIQDVYSRDIPIKHDWNFLFVDSSLTTTAEYKVGTCKINTGTTGVGFSSDVTIDGTFVGRRIKISGGDAIYDITSSASASSATILAAFQANNNASGASYSIFQPQYALAKDFGRFPKMGGIYQWQGGKKKLLEEESFHEQSNEFQASPNSTPAKVRLSGVDTAGNQLMEFRPAPNKAQVFGYTYIRKLFPMIETTQGTVAAIAASGTTVTGNASRFTDANTGDYFRLDVFGKSQDSTWYPIASIANDSSLTLVAAFANTAVTSGATYTIARAPQMPFIMHPAIIYGSLETMATDQGDPAVQVYHAKYGQILSDAKRLYVSRVYNQKVETIAEDYRYRR